jgi:hypothetical protein
MSSTVTGWHPPSVQEPSIAWSPSSARFPEGGQYRVEIPSVEHPRTAELVLRSATDHEVPIHRLSQGSGIALLTDDELDGFARVGADSNVEICLFVGTRAPWDGVSPSALVGDGRNVGWRNVGMRSLLSALGDVHRAVEHGIRSVLVADEGLVAVLGEERRQGKLPADLQIKISALVGIANPVGAAVLEFLGASSINVPSDSMPQDLSDYRSALTVPIDIYIESPDGLGGFLRYFDVGEIVRAAAPVHLKFGLKNAGGIYPAGEHLRGLAEASAIERVRRARIGLDHLKRQYPEAVAAPAAIERPGVPKP